GIKIKWAGRNLGFARANNLIIRNAVQAGAKFIMLLNPDTILEPGAVESLVAELENDHQLGSVSAKILRWDFKNQKKTEVIDSCGIVVRSGLRFFDLGQAQSDIGQFDRADILGPSGAAPIYRLSALEKIKQGSEYFDELMFMSKEDCDLAYRFYLSDSKSKLVPMAKIYHDRTTYGTGESDLRVALNRRHKDKQIKKWSFLYQHIIFIKFWQTQKLLEKLAILIYAFKMFIFALFFEQYLLKQYYKIWQIKKKIKIYKNSTRLPL
ncbi:MAG: hypothetical protein ABIH91_00615, partial [Candidatus Omnitrophota bacterium]